MLENFPRKLEIIFRYFGFRCELAQEGPADRPGIRNAKLSVYALTNFLPFFDFSRKKIENEFQILEKNR